MDLSGFDCSILDSTNCLLGEGPTYDPETDTLWWFDITGRKLLEHRLGDGHSAIHDLPFLCSALAVADGGRQVIASENGLYERSPSDGALTRIAGIEADDETTRSNDSRVHPCGAFWVGTMSKIGQENAGSIYHYFRGELKPIFTGITVTNAICFSADGSVGYFTDTPTGKVMRVSLDPQSGLPIGQAEAFIVRTPDHPGWADGAVIDADGLMWIARWDGSCVQAYDAAGSVVETIRLPASQITCPAFIGKDASRMILTSAAEGISEQRLIEQPHAGMTFMIDRRVNGRIEPKVSL